MSTLTDFPWVARCFKQDGDDDGEDMVSCAFSSLKLTLVSDGVMEIGHPFLYRLRNTDVAVGSLVELLGVWCRCKAHREVTRYVWDSVRVFFDQVAGICFSAALGKRVRWTALCTSAWPWCMRLCHQLLCAPTNLLSRGKNDGPHAKLVEKCFFEVVKVRALTPRWC